MKSSKLMSSRMSIDTYSGKKNTWKWTPAKIAAFSLFGFMLLIIIYFESNSNRSSFEAPTTVIEEPPLPVETTDFDKEYQEFLKRGQKIITEETLDSLNQIQSSIQSSPPTDNTPISNTRSSNTNPVKAPVTNPTVTEPAFTATADKKVENKPPPGNSDRKVIGTLEETTPPIITNTADKFENAVSDNPISEEFYIEETITGTIKALSDGTAIQGVTVTVKGTNRSTVSDSNGGYSITVPGDPQHRTLQYSFHGNVTERDVSPGSNIINIRF